MSTQTSPSNIFAITEDWPKKGVRFFHMGPWLQNQVAFKADLAAMAKRFSHLGVTHIAYMGARGFLMTPLSELLHANSVIIRKKGELPDPVIESTYSGEYRKDTTIVLSKGDISPDARVLIVDDVLATGGTAIAAIDLVKSTGATVVGFAVLLELKHLGGRKAIVRSNGGVIVYSQYDAQEDGSFCRKESDQLAIPGRRTLLDEKAMRNDERVVVMWHDTAVEQALALVNQYPKTFVAAPIKTRRFPDGHYDIEFEPNLVGRHLVYVMSLLNPEETLHQLELLIALGRQHIQSFTVILNYFAPGTKERVDQPGELARAQTTAQLITDSLKALPIAGPATVVIYDIHALQEQFYFGDSCSLALLSSSSLMGKIVESEKMILVFPDQGAYKRFGKEPELKNVPTFICNKERGPDGARTVVIADRKGCDGLTDEALKQSTVLIYDDILHSGGTAWETYLLLKQMGFQKICLYATHAVLSNQAWMRFLPNGDRAGFDRIYTTNSVPSLTERYLKFYPDTFSVLDLTPITANFLFKKYKYPTNGRVPARPDVWFGTTSKHKTQAILNVFPQARFFEGVDTSSGVNPQPVGHEGVRLGATNRLNTLKRAWLNMNGHERIARELSRAPTILVAIETGIVYDESKTRDHTVVMVAMYDENGQHVRDVTSEDYMDVIAASSSAVNYSVGPIIPVDIMKEVRHANFTITAGKLICAAYPDQQLDDGDWYNAKMKGIDNQPISRVEYMSVYLKEATRPFFAHFN